MRFFTFFLFIITLVISGLFPACKENNDPQPGSTTDTLYSHSSDTIFIKDADTLLKDGYISGTLLGAMSSGDTINEAFHYKVYTSIKESQYSDGEGYYFEVKRRGIDTANHFAFEFDIYGDTMSAPTSMNIDFGYTKELSGGGTFLSFEDGNMGMYGTFNDSNVWIADTNLTVNNFSFSPARGELSFGYEIRYDTSQNNTGNAARLQGNVDVSVRKAVSRQSGNVLLRQDP